MSDPSKSGMSNQGPDDRYAADEVRKSNLILQARLLLAQNQEDAAAAHFAKAAEWEEQLTQRCLTGGMRDKAAAHHFSAAGCWAQAGNFFRAIVLCDELLGQAGVTDRLRREAQEYAHKLRVRRAEYYAGLTAVAAGA